MDPVRIAVALLVVVVVVDVVVRLTRPVGRAVAINPDEAVWLELYKTVLAALVESEGKDCLLLAARTSRMAANFASDALLVVRDRWPSSSPAASPAEPSPQTSRTPPAKRPPPPPSPAAFGSAMIVKPTEKIGPDPGSPPPLPVPGPGRSR